MNHSITRRVLGAALMLGAIGLSMPGLLQAAPESATSSGVVRRVNPEQGTIAIKGPAIDDLNLPEMILEYHADPAMLRNIHASDKVKFTVVKDGSTYRITEIKK